MAGSCCSDCSPEDAQDEARIDAGVTDPTDIKPPVDDMCCKDGPCECSDDCLEEYARVICADDAGHIHDAEATTQHTSIGGVEMHDKQCSGNECSSATPRCEFMNSSVAPETCTAKETKCASDCAFWGVRKRSTRSPPPSCSEAGPHEHPKKACGQHASIAQSRYRATLSAFGCVCKALLAHGLQSCCTTTKAAKEKTSIRATVRFSKAAKAKREHSGKSCAPGNSKSRQACGHGDATATNASRVSVHSCCKDSCGGDDDTHDLKSHSCVSFDTCCGKGDCSSGKGYAAEGEPRKSVDSCSSKDGCCSGKEGLKSLAPLDSGCTKGGCCGISDTRKSASRISVNSCKDSCCGDSHVQKSSGGCCDSNSCDEKLPLDVTPSALEKGLGELEHAVLAIKGMTCTGCENKVIRVLGGIPTITNVKTSLVLCRAEFDYDSSNAIESLVDVISKRTGFGIDLVKGTRMRELPLTVDRALQVAFLEKDRPKGVEDISRTNKDTLSITFNPELVGARVILEAYADYNPVLAPEPRDPALTAGASHIRTLAARVVLSAALTIPVLVMAWAPLPTHPHAYAIASLALATVVQVAITGPVYAAAFKSLFFSRLVETDMLVVLSTTAAYVYSVVAFAYSMAGRPLPIGQFFETSTLLVTLIMLGQLVSAYARQRAMEAISIRSLQSTTATLVHADGREENIDARLLQHGDTFKVVPDSSIITDGTVTAGHSSVDESMMTGESHSVEKTVGSAAIAGTLNGGGTLLVRVTRLPGENTIADIAGMVDDARFSRAKVQSTVDKVCGLFVPIVLALAATTFVVWLAVGMGVRGQSSEEAAVTALTYAIAVLAISCPCAIGLAVPMVILVAGGVAAKHGLVFKAATTIEEARKITHVVFDKTGTLTQGKLDVVTATYPGAVEGVDVQAAVKELVTDSNHPVARAVEAHLAQHSTSSDMKLADVQAVTGKGVQGLLNGSRIRGGSPVWLNLTSHPSVEPLLASGLTVFCVSLACGPQDVPIAVFALSDVLRPEAAAVIATLHAKNIRTSILSGDHASAVSRIAAPLGLPTENLRAGCLPAEKQAYIKELEARGENVLFVGDGTNDAAALAQATIGVHLHSSIASNGTTVSAAASAADVVLTHPSLTGLLTLFALSEAVHRRIMLNFAWSAVYNLVAILFAAGAFVNARIAPAYAGLGEVVSVVPVVVVAMLLRLFNPRA